MGNLRVLDSSGDSVTTWAPDDLRSVTEAESLFHRLVKEERRLAFARAVGATAEDAVQIRTFDPMAEEIIMVRPIQGG
jgi:hypothetical protein